MSASPPAIRIGCSGWVYPHWRGRFYPQDLPQRRWFAFYAEHFDTVEINNSFYRLPSAEAFAAWHDQAPPGFCYAVKANRFLTQAKKLMGCAEPLERMLTPLAALGAATGPLLFQLPPRFKLNIGRLEEFLDALPREPTPVFEFRDASWLTEDVLALLDRSGASFCAHDLPGFATPRWAAGPIAYVRFHGGVGKYWGRYSDAALAEWTDWIVAQRDEGRAVWAYFNNDIDGHAIDDALTFKAMVRQAVG